MLVGVFFIVLSLMNSYPNMEGPPKNLGFEEDRNTDDADVTCMIADWRSFSSQ